MLIHGNVTPVTAGSPVEWLRHSLDQEADDWSDLLDRYLEGWAENNLSKISSAMAPGYCLDDPHVGQFSRRSISLYFERVRTRFASVGGCTPNGSIAVILLAYSTKQTPLPHPAQDQQQ